MTTSTTPAEDRVRELIAENKRLNDRNVEVSMLAHQWMVAHDNRAAGLPVTYPSPADVPASLFLLALMAAAAEEQTRILSEVSEGFDHFRARAQALTLERDAMREGLSKIAAGLTPPGPHGHYLAHREAVKVARDLLALPHSSTGEG